MLLRAIGIIAALSVLLVLGMPVRAASFKGASASVSETKTHMIIATETGHYSVPVLDGQVGFSNVAVSPDGRYIGWLVVYQDPGNASNQFAGSLVVVDLKTHIMEFDADGDAIFGWCFFPDSKSVAFSQGSLHFDDSEEFDWYSIESKRLLERYLYPDDWDVKPELRSNDARAKAMKAAPAWVKCVPKSGYDD